MAARTPLAAARALPQARAEATPLRDGDEADPFHAKGSRAAPLRRLLLATPLSEAKSTARKEISSAHHGRNQAALRQLSLLAAEKARTPQHTAEDRAAAAHAAPLPAQRTPPPASAKGSKCTPSPQAASRAAPLYRSPAQLTRTPSLSQGAGATPIATAAAPAQQAMGDSGSRKTTCASLEDRLHAECSEGGSAEALMRHLAEAGSEAPGLVLGDARMPATPVAAAAAAGFLDLVQLLLDFGASPEPLSPTQVAPLAAAAENGRVHIASLLLDAGAEVETTSSGVLWQMGQPHCCVMQSDALWA